jgi:FkbM family methyltransferase
MGITNWLKHLKPHSGQRPVFVLPPEGVEPRGFHGKSAFADQVNLIGRDANVIFDIGANCGQTTERYLDLFRTATIHSFEPFPPSYTQLTRRFPDYDRLRCYPLAVSDGVGKRSFHTFTNSVTNSLLPAVADVYKFVEPGEMEDTGVITVESVTIDEFCRREQIAHIDILKLDIQGGDVQALRGAETMLSQERVGLVYAEVLFVPVYERQGYYHDMALCLSTHGYRLYDFYNFTYTETGQVRWGDAIFLPVGTESRRK